MPHSSGVQAVKIWVLEWSGYREDSLLGCKWPPSCCILMARNTRDYQKDFCAFSQKGTDPFHKGATCQVSPTSQRHLNPIPINLGVRVSRCKLGWKTDIPCTTPVYTAFSPPGPASHRLHCSWLLLRASGRTVFPELAKAAHELPDFLQNAAQ